MKFHYTGFKINGDEIIYRPLLPINICYKKVRVPMNALVDTGADRTILPLEVATVFGFTFDLHNDGEEWEGAGGGKFRVYKSPEPVIYEIEQKGFRTKKWPGSVYFTLKQPTVLLGHKDCLDHLNITFYGRERMLEIE